MPSSRLLAHASRHALAGQPRALPASSAGRALAGSAPIPADQSWGWQAVKHGWRPGRRARLGQQHALGLHLVAVQAVQQHEAQRVPLRAAGTGSASARHDPEVCV
jgi:hypothetical protein